MTTESEVNQEEPSGEVAAIGDTSCEEETEGSTTEFYLRRGRRRGAR